MPRTYYISEHTGQFFPSQAKPQRRAEYIVSYSVLPIIIFCLLFVIHFLSASFIFAQETIDISADRLEYLSETNTYIAKGSAIVTSGNTILKADDIRLNNTTSEALAVGNVVYEDIETIINADRIELNLKTKLGVIYNSYIFYKKENYHLRGGDLRKFGEKSYFLDTASVTTCDASPPAWHISGKSIKTELHSKIESKDTTLYIKNVPVLYTPYFWMPLSKKRQTGFLVPSAGSSNTKGFIYEQGFFWAIKENKDATFYLDYFSKKGFGKGIEYRYIINSENRGRFWGYHLRDTDLKRDFIEIKSYNNMQLPYGITSYLKLHTVNTFDYYDILGETSSRTSALSSLISTPISSWRSALFDFESSDRLQKYLESNLHLSKPFHGGRVYLLDQYRQSLEEDSDIVPDQNVVSLGIILNTGSKGPIMYDVSFTGSDFRSDDGDEGQRLDLKSRLYLSHGRAVNLKQEIGLRETVYFLSSPDKNKDRLLLDLSSSITTRLMKRYSSFIHLIEPSLEYVYIPDAGDDDIPFFDSTESIEDVSSIIYSLTNRIESYSPSGLNARFRLSQSYNLLKDDNRFTPIVAEGSLSSAIVDLSINTSYDIHESRLTDSIASIAFKNSAGYIKLGKNYRHSTDLDQYTIDAGTTKPLKIKGRSIPLFLYGKLWYDLKGAGVQESRIKTTYRSQCWAITFMYSKRPDEDQISFNIELVGLGALKW
jgi:LPS-assembly protein